MPAWETAIQAGVALVGSAMSSRSKKKAAAQTAQAQEEGAALSIEAQERASREAIEEQRRQFDKLREILSPFVERGVGAIAGLEPFVETGRQALMSEKALAGLAGEQAQQEAIEQITKSPLLQAQIQAGEEALLQKASATGGLRGGNIQAALAQFRPQMIQQAINQQYSRLGGLSDVGRATGMSLAQLGQVSAAGVGTGSMQTAQRIGAQLGQTAQTQGLGATTIGQAQAAQALTEAQARGSFAGSATKTLGDLAGQYFGRREAASQDIDTLMATNPELF